MEFMNILTSVYILPSMDGPEMAGTVAMTSMGTLTRGQTHSAIDIRVPRASMDTLIWGYFLMV